MSAPLRIATRQSPLALWQAEHVKARLVAAHRDLSVELLPMTTEGDRRLSASLANIGGKGLFVKELEQAMLENRADLAVHSMKDVPAALPEGLCLSAFLRGEDPRDAFVSDIYDSLESLPSGAVIGTASLRRRAQLLRLRPDLQVVEVRGNVGTRLARMEEGRCVAMLLAHAGLERLGLAARIRESFDVDHFVPAIAQGVIGIECRSDDRRVRQLLKPLHDSFAATRLAAERAMGARMGGACTVPVAGHARLHEGRLQLTGLVAAPDGKRLVRGTLAGRRNKAAELGERLAEHLLNAGGREILAGLGINV